MNGLVWKALRREWFLVRWAEWAWIALRRQMLHVRWAIRDAGRWLVAGWGWNWIEWRWRHVRSAGTFVGALFTEVFRPLQAMGQAVLLGVSDRDRKWVAPAITGTIGLLLLLLLFTRPETSAVGSPSASEEPEAPPAPVPEPTEEPPEDRIVDVPGLRDPFAGLVPPVPMPDPDPIPDPVPDPVPAFEPDPIPDPLPLVPAELAIRVTRDAIDTDWQPRLDSTPERHVSSAARRIAPLPVRVSVDDRPDGWDRYRPRFVDPNLTTVAHGLREFALATASSTMVGSLPDPIPQRAPEPPVVDEPPAEPPPEPPMPEPLPEPAPAEPEPVPAARVEWNAMPLEPTGMVGKHCVLDLELSNVGDAPATELVVRIDLPDQLEHDLGSAIDLPVGTLEPGETRTARLVALASRPGRGAFEVRLVGDGIEESRSPTVRVTALASEPAPEPRRSLPSRPPVFGLCCPTR